MAITVREALLTEGLVQARVVAGQHGVDNRVETITVLESPEIFPWLRGNEIILTSLYAVRDMLEARRTLVERLAGCGCAGLIIKTGRFVSEVPAEVLEPANRLGFPIIELPLEVHYVDVITPLMERILTDRGRLLRHAESTRRSLTRAALSGGGLPAIAESVADLAGCHAVVLDTALRCVARSSGIDRTFLSAWLEVHDPVSLPWFGLAEPEELPGPDGGGAVTVPVRVDRETLGHLLLYPMRLPLAEEVGVVVEDALTVAALELLKQRAVREVERRYHDEVLADVVDGRTTSESLKQRARHLDWDLQSRYRVMLLDLSALRSGSADALRHAAREGALRTVKGLSPRPIVGQVLSTLAVLLPEGATSRLEAEIEALGRAIQFQVAHMTASPKTAVGISEKADHLHDLQQAYEEARDALELGGLVHGSGAIAFFRQLGVYRLLKDCAPPLRADFVESVLGPMLALEMQKGEVLIETLKAYLKANGQAKQAGDALYVHANTVKYRLHQIEELTGHSPETSEGRLNLMLAMKLLDLRGRTP